MRDPSAGSISRKATWLSVPGVVLTVALAVSLYACGSDASSESTSPPTTVAAPGRSPTPTTVATTTVAAKSTGTAKEATRALCAEIESAGRTVAEGRFVAGGLALSRAVNRYGDDADRTVVDPAKRMLAAGLNGDLDAGAAAIENAASACRRLGHPLNLPTGGGGGKQCVTTPCN